MHLVCSMLFNRLSNTESIIIKAYEGYLVIFFFRVLLIHILGKLLLTKFN